MTDRIFPELSDAQLLKRHLQGDPDAFGQLFLRHRDRLWAVALRTLCDPEEAADALQEAMISAFRRAGDFRGESAVTTWLHRIVVNASLDRLRRRTAHSVSSVGDEGTLDLLATQGRVPATTDPASVRDTALDVEAALRLIPPEQRAALVLVDMLGYPVADAAAVLEISPGTVKSRCARGRARLLPYLEHLRSSTPAAEVLARKRDFHGTVRQPAASHLGREEMDEASFGACGRERPGRAQRRADQRPPRHPDPRAPGGLPALRERQCWAVRRACPAGVRSAVADARSGDRAAERGDRRGSSGPLRCGGRP